MALSIEIPFKKEIPTTKSLSEIETFFKTPENAIGKNFPGLESLALLSSNNYEWRFEKLSYSGYELSIKFESEFIFGKEGFKIKPISTTLHRLEADWRYLPKPTGTTVSLNMRITLELPIPSLMRAMVEPLAKKELTKLLERFTDNLGKALA